MQSTQNQVTAQTRHFTASMVVLDLTHSRVLLVEHKASGWWQFPGGHVDPDETADEAAMREVLEETGIVAVLRLQTVRRMPGMVQQPTPWRVYEIPAPAKPDRPGKPAEPAHSHIDFLFVGTADSAGTVPVVQEAEATGVGWFDIGLLGTITARFEVERTTWQAVNALIRGGDAA